MTSAINIGTEDGAVRIVDCAVVLIKGISRSEVAAATSSLFLNESDFGNGYRWLRLQRVSLGGAPCILSLCFFRDRLSEMQLNLSDSESPAETEVAFVRAELSRQLGRSFGSGREDFPWGIVWSETDARFGEATAGLRYAGPLAPPERFPALRLTGRIVALLLAVFCLLYTAQIEQHLGYRAANLSRDLRLLAAIIAPAWLAAAILTITLRARRPAMRNLTLIFLAIELVLLTFVSRAIALNRKRHQQDAAAAVSFSR